MREVEYMVYTYFKYKNTQYDHLWAGVYLEFKSPPDTQRTQYHEPFTNPDIAPFWL